MKDEEDKEDGHIEITSEQFLTTTNKEQVEAHLADVVEMTNNPHLVFRFEELEDDFKVHFMAKGMDGDCILRAVSLFETAINKYADALETENMQIPELPKEFPGEDCND